MANIPAQLYRGDSDYLGTISNVDGQILFDTDKKEIFVDDGTTRESYGGGSATVISYANFSQLTPQEQESGNYLVTGMPSLTNAYNIEYKNGVDVGTELDNINTDLSAKTITVTSDSGGYVVLDDYDSELLNAKAIIATPESLDANVPNITITVPGYQPNRQHIQCVPMHPGGTAITNFTFKIHYVAFY